MKKNIITLISAIALASVLSIVGCGAAQPITAEAETASEYAGSESSFYEIETYKSAEKKDSQITVRDNITKHQEEAILDDLGLDLSNVKTGQTELSTGEYVDYVYGEKNGNISVMVAKDIGLADDLDSFLFMSMHGLDPNDFDIDKICESISSDYIITTSKCE